MSKTPSQRRRTRPGRSADSILQAAIDAAGQNDWPLAERECRLALEICPNWAAALHVLGVACFRQKRLEEAIDTLNLAVAAAPDRTATYSDLANVLDEAGRCEEAVNALQQLTRRNSKDVRAWNNLGVILKQLDRLEESVSALQTAVSLEPDYLLGHLNLSYALLKRRALPAAEAAVNRALQLDPRHVEAIRLSIRLYRLQDKHERALEAYKTWLTLEPDNPIPRHMIDSYQGICPPVETTVQYVRSEFDQFAESFDKTLAELQYQAPRLVTQAISNHWGAPQSNRRILDAGCGTGLAGPGLRPFASFLAGVDLSPKMLAKAKATGVYDHLGEADLLAYLAGQVEPFDLIAVIDTFVYFADLVVPFQACRQCLIEGGSLAFTVEQTDESSSFQVSRSGRFQHHRMYLQQTLAAAGFGSIEMDDVVLRQERSQPVRGLLVWAE